MFGLFNNSMNLGQMAGGMDPRMQQLFGRIQSQFDRAGDHQNAMMTQGPMFKTQNPQNYMTMPAQPVGLMQPQQHMGQPDMPNFKPMQPRSLLG